MASPRQQVGEVIDGSERLERTYTPYDGGSIFPAKCGALSRRTTQPARTPAVSIYFSDILLTGCVIGNRGTVHVTRHITLGQELSDLKLALDNGSITLSEYQALRAKIFESADHVLGSADWGGVMTLENHDHDSRSPAAEAVEGEGH